MMNSEHSETAESQTSRIRSQANHDVFLSTAKLMYLLEGMESVRERHSGTFAAPRLSRSAVIPLASVVDTAAILVRDGEVEQLAYRGWIDEVLQINERARSEIQKVNPGWIRPENDAWGDLRKIRNDVVHEGGLPLENTLEKRLVLKWHYSGGHVRLTMDHVFDFLNQIGLMFSGSQACLTDLGQVVQYGYMPKPYTNENSPPSWLISVRTSIDENGPDGSTRWAASCVFDGGRAFLFDMFDCLNARISAKEFLIATAFMGMMQFSNGTALSGEELYEIATSPDTEKLNEP